MKYVQRANEVLRVPDDAVKEYLASGYDILDDEGKKVVQKAEKSVYTATEYNALKAEIATLKAAMAKKTKNKSEEETSATDEKTSE